MKTSYRAGFFALLVLLLAITATHLGNRSPYSYGWPVMMPENHRETKIEMQPVNPDALSIAPLTTGFVKTCGIDYHAPNIHLPLHSMAAATILSFTHSYMFSMLLLNVACAAALLLVLFRIAKEHSLPPSATFVAGALLILLPAFAHYMGQPMQYVYGIAADWILTVAVIRHVSRETPSPVFIGVALALMSFSYDWLVYGAAIVLFVLLFKRFERRRDYVTMAVVALAPMALWQRFISYATPKGLSDQVKARFVDSFVKDWSIGLSDPLRHVPDLFVGPHVALIVMVKAVLSMMWWPLLIAVVAIAIWRRAPLLQTVWGQLIACILLAYTAEQFVTVSSDLEANPRRAFPVMFALVVTMVWAIASSWGSRKGRALFIGLAVVSLGADFTDTLFKNPAVGLLQTGETVRGETKAPLERLETRLDDPTTVALLTPEGPIPFGKWNPECGKLIDPDWAEFDDLQAEPAPTEGLSRARILGDFVLSQVVFLLASLAMAWVLVRSAIASRRVAIGGVAIVLLSFAAKIVY